MSDQNKLLFFPSGMKLNKFKFNFFYLINNFSLINKKEFNK
jgi:hypothetical protein